MAFVCFTNFPRMGSHLLPIYLFSLCSTHIQPAEPHKRNDRQRYSNVKYKFICSMSVRLLWMSCVTLALALFSLQVASRIRVYINYETNVDVSVQYTSVMDFPAVTLCNQNTYRLGHQNVLQRSECSFSEF